MKVIIAGTRNYDNYEELKFSLNTLRSNNYLPNLDTIVSGGCRGADRLGERYAYEHQLKVVIFAPEWDEYGKAAGPIRNIEMANFGDVLVAFWNGKSRGTEHMINAMHERNKQVHLFKI